MKEDLLESLFSGAPSAIAHHEIILDSEGRPFDYRFIKVNPAFGKMTGLDAAGIIGKTVREAIPGIEKSDFDWIGFAGRIALDGGHKALERYSEHLGRW